MSRSIILKRGWLIRRQRMWDNVHAIVPEFIQHLESGWAFRMAAKQCSYPFCWDYWKDELLKYPRVKELHEQYSKRNGNSGLGRVEGFPVDPALLAGVPFHNSKTRRMACPEKA